MKEWEACKTKDGGSQKKIKEQVSAATFQGKNNNACETSAQGHKERLHEGKFSWCDSVIGIFSGGLASCTLGASGGSKEHCPCLIAPSSFLFLSFDAIFSFLFHWFFFFWCIQLKFLSLWKYPNVHMALRVLLLIKEQYTVENKSRWSTCSLKKARSCIINCQLETTLVEGKVKILVVTSQRLIIRDISFVYGIRSPETFALNYSAGSLYSTRPSFTPLHASLSPPMLGNIIRLLTLARMASYFCIFLLHTSDKNYGKGWLWKQTAEM